jgi:hypothetical protein
MMRCIKVTSFDGERGYLGDRETKPVRLISFDGVAYVVDADFMVLGEDDAVDVILPVAYRVVKDDHSDTLSVVTVRDTDLLKGLTAEYGRIQSAEDSEPPEETVIVDHSGMGFPHPMPDE